MISNTFRGWAGCCTTMLLPFIVGHAPMDASRLKPKPAQAKAFTTLRSSDSELMEAVAQGLARSPTLRDLESHLERSLVVVYLARAEMPHGLAARTRLIGSGDGWRFLSIEIDRLVEKTETLSLLGHELQHAVEIADAPEVIDLDSLAALYRRIGLDASNVGSAPLSFETRGALEAGKRVRTELTGWS